LLLDDFPAMKTLPAVLLLAILQAACADVSRLGEAAQSGPNPELPAPQSSLIPTVKIAPARGWPQGRTPEAAPGLAVAAFASGLEHPRWVYVLPNGDVLVAETAAPHRPEDGKGIKGWAMKKIMKRAGSAVPSANRITLLRDADGDGKAETRSAFLENLNSPFGMALVGGTLYVANTDAVLKFGYQAGQTRIESRGEKVAGLPGGPLNHHWTKNLIASPDGKRLYASVGSNSNVAENGVDKEANRAAILEIDPASGATRLFASGLRNPNGMDWHPHDGRLWTVVNERDELGSDLVPDYLTSVKEGGFYGWPYSYFGRHVDKRAQPPRPDLVEKAIVPDYALGSHVAPLGLVFYQQNLFPEKYRGGAFIGLHGSWNRKPLSGYRVVYVPFQDGKPASPVPADILTGFVDEDGKAMGRPVGVAVDRQGALLVADDVGNTVWRVTPAP
jgi:glucose/arabinose dehydrogenase